MKYILLLISLFIINSCKGQKEDKLIIIKKNDCHDILKEFVITSNITNPFKNKMDVEIEDIDSNKATLKLFVKDNITNENTVGWLVIDKKQQKLLDITNDIEHPQNLIYKKKIWENIMECYFKNTNKKNHKMNAIKFSDLFNEGTNIEFSPNDLKTDNRREVTDFKNKLELYEKQHADLASFDIKNLSYLINNETFFDLQYYTNSGWLQYFIKTYKIDSSRLTDIMSLAIKQEDFIAVKILIENNYIVSKKDIDIISYTENEVKEKIKENKTDGYESYLISNSKINMISNLLLAKFKANKIQDSDGYTNLRKDKLATSEVLQKVKSGENIEVIDNSGDWFLVKTKEGKEGYIHKSRIKSK